MSNGNRSAGSPPLAEQGDNADGGNQSAARNDNPGANEAGGVSTPVEQPASPNEAVEGKQQAERQEYNPYDARDIVAQEAMADASIAMAVAALLTFVVTGIGTFFLAWQVKLTREAVKDTGDATKAMVRQNELTETAQRPYLIVEVGKSPTEENERGHVTAVEYRYRNIGSTPAQIVRQSHRVVMLDEFHDLPDKLDPSVKGDGRIVPSGEIAIRNEATAFAPAGPVINRRVESVDGEWKLVEGTPSNATGLFKRPTFFHGYVIYEDMEKRTYIRGFCFRYGAGKFRIAHNAQSENYEFRCNPDGTPYDDSRHQTGG
ncbi:hypothetical protein [Altererythrobacter sp. MTPC7]|uniref:hypothetical protein n=1 Tax=Altererythrobacter sp. MTPC7 TaxID=3056567 RepID=UPI0036F23028